MGCVYLITSPSGKQYVGMTTRTVAERWAEHSEEARCGSDRFLHRAMRKYGVKAFNLDVLHQNEVEQVLHQLEMEEIFRRKTLAPSGYNMTEGGEGGRHCQAVRARMSRNQRTLRADPNAIYHTAEFREKLSVGIKAAWADPETAYNSAELRAARSRNTKAAWADPQSSFNSPEYRRKQKLHLKKLQSDPELAKARSDRVRAIWKDPDSSFNAPGYLERMASAVKASWTQDRKREQAHRTAATWSAPNSVFRSDEYRQKQSHCSTLAQRARHPNYFADGAIFHSKCEAACSLGMSQSGVDGRLDSSSPRFRWWHTIPNHNDVDCDAVEECWAVMQWAKANPDHANVPDWLRPDRPKHGPAPAWAKRAAA